MKRIVILISGTGSNMRAIVQQCAARGWTAQVVAVISNRPDAAGLAFARDQGLSTQVLDHRAYTQRQAFDEALADAVESHAPDLVVLAGFMRILGEAFVQRFAGRLLNIHPSLLPAFAGLHTHRRALEAGCQVAGATVHYVTGALDSGPIVIQSVVPVLPGDDEHRLAQRVLATEHHIYPLAVYWHLSERLQVQGHRVVQLDGAPQVYGVADAISSQGRAGL